MAIAVWLIAALFVIVLPAAAFTDDMRVLLRTVARMQGCTTPALTAMTKEDGLLEVTATCLAPGEGQP